MTKFASSVMQLAVSQDTPEIAHMTIYGDIRGGIDWGKLDDGVSTKTGSANVADALLKLPASTKAIEVHINSYGGEVAEGVAIYNALRNSGKEIATVCDGFACSIASVIFMAGSKRIMRPASLLMLHNPSSIAAGTSKDLRKSADDLDVICELSKTAYLKGGKIDADTLTSAMDAETWVAPEKAVEWGLATDVEDGESDSDEPTQSAAQSVMQRLLQKNAEITLDDFAKSLTKYLRMDLEPNAFTPNQQEPEQDYDTQPEPEPKHELEPEQDADAEPQQKAQQEEKSLIQRLVKILD